MHINRELIERLKSKAEKQKSEQKKMDEQFLVGMIVKSVYQGQQISGVIIERIKLIINELHVLYFYTILCENEITYFSSTGINKSHYVNYYIVDFICMSIAYKFAYNSYFHIVRNLLYL
jgi:hypothetical protein